MPSAQRYDISIIGNSCLKTLFPVTYPVLLSGASLCEHVQRVIYIYIILLFLVLVELTALICGLCVAILSVHGLNAKQFNCIWIKKAVKTYLHSTHDLECVCSFPFSFILALLVVFLCPLFSLSSWYYEICVIFVLPKIVLSPVFMPHDY